MKFVILFGCLTALTPFSLVAATQTPKTQELTEFAAAYKNMEASVLKINLAATSGSGVIIHRQGDLYTAVTNRHVVCGNLDCSQLPPGQKYQLELPDGQKLNLQNSAVQLLGNNLDLAIVQFRHKNSYRVAVFAPIDQLKAGAKVYTAGFPYKKTQMIAGLGQTIAVVNKRIVGDRGGYTVVYDALTQPGMSGGGVFNTNGQLVAIHGVGDRYMSGTDDQDDFRLGSKLGINRGIPIRWLVQSLKSLGVSVGNAPVDNAAVQASTADEHFVIGLNQFIDPGSNFIQGKRQAAQALSKAIQINPKYAKAYWLRGRSFRQIKEYRSALRDFNQVLILDPQNAVVYNERAMTKMALQDTQGALADFDQAVLIAPNNISYLYNLALLKFQYLNDLPGALQALNRVIALNPDFSFAYNNRANVKTRLNDWRGALQDYNKSISLYPDNAEAYYSRATLKHRKLNDKVGAITDYQRAAQLFRSRKQTQDLQDTLDRLRQLGATE
jgi:Flp pilus assembly protein TadD/S1-C subfamily serine protease